MWREYVLGKKSSVSFSVFPFPSGIIQRSAPSGVTRLNITQAESRRKNQRAAAAAAAASREDASKVPRDEPIAFPIDRLRT